MKMERLAVIAIIILFVLMFATGNYHFVLSFIFLIDRSAEFSFDFDSASKTNEGFFIVFKDISQIRV